MKGQCKKNNKTKNVIRRTIVFGYFIDLNGYF